MPITFPCDCGKQLKVGDEYAGKRAKCPACGGVLTGPAGQFDPIEEPPLKTAPARRVAEEEDEDDRPRRPARARGGKKTKTTRRTNAPGNGDATRRTRTVRSGRNG